MGAAKRAVLVGADITVTHADEVAEVADALGVSRRPALLFLILWGARGRTVSYDMIMDSLEASTRSFMTLDAVAASKKRLANALKGQPVTIEAVYGIGYRLTVHDEAWRVSA